MAVFKHCVSCPAAWRAFRLCPNAGAPFLCGVRFAVRVCGAIPEFILEAPFDTRMLNSDNGGECVNGP